MPNITRRFGTVREVTFDLFRQLGITDIFGNPGSTELPMFRDFPEDFRYILGLQESVVVGMADGYAQAKNNAAVVNLHSAAGVGHALGNIYTAYRNQTPLIITAGQQARSILPFDAFLSAESATEFPKPYIKYSVEPARAEDVPRAIARAYQIAMQEPRGPVFVSVPVDDWDRDAEFLEMRNVSSTRFPDPVIIEGIASALGKATNPALVIGASVDRGGAWDAAVALAEKHQAKVYSAPHSNRCGFPENHPLFAGALRAAREDIVKTLTGHDYVLVVGAPAFAYHVEGEGPHVPPDAILFLITEVPELAAWAPAGNALVADIKPTLDALVASGIRTKRAAPPEAPSAPRIDADGPISLEYLMQTLGSLYDPATMVVEEAPTSKAVRQAYLKISRPRSSLSTASGGLGYGMPAAVGFALGEPGRRVLAIMGDGSSMYSIQALYTAAQLGLPITFVIVNNKSYRALEQFGGYFQMPSVPGTKLPSIDFTGLATAMGVTAKRVDRSQDLEAALSDAMSAAGPALVDVLLA